MNAFICFDVVSKQYLRGRKPSGFVFGDVYVCFEQYLLSKLRRPFGKWPLYFLVNVVEFYFCLLICVY